MSPIQLLEDPYQYYSPIYTWVFQVVSFPQVSPPKPCMHLFSPHSCYMSSLFHFLNLIIPIIFGEEYRTQSSSLCSFSTPLSQSIRHYKDTQRYDIPCCSVATLISCSVLWEEHKSNVLRKSFLE